MYYKVKIRDQETIVKAKNPAKVRKYILDELKDSYSYSRANTDDVVDYLGKGALNDLDSMENHND